MRTGLRIIGGAVAMLTLAVWLVTGAHTGWTRTSTTVMKIDPITEIEYPETQKKFIAGVELVGAGLVAALALFGCSFLFKKQSTNKP